VEIEKTTARVDLSLIVNERGVGAEAVFEYSTDLFEPATVDRIATSFVRLLDAIVGSPDEPITTLAIMSEQERREQILDWNSTLVDYPPRLLHELVEEQVDRSPDAVAVVFGTERLTYGELDARANQVARRLRRLGVGSESLVAVYMTRSLE